MPGLPDLHRIAEILRDQAGQEDLRAEDLEPMREKGIAHAHFRLPGRGLVLRIPRLSQWALPAAENLAYQAACFARAAPSGATPGLVAVLTVGPELPQGALLVEEILGRPPLLPQELPAIAAALARLHALPLPEAAARPPLLDHGDEGPFRATLAVIRRQLPALDTAPLPKMAVSALRDELSWVEDFAQRMRGAEHPITLVGTDTHPGNFLIRRDGRAVLVDLEKALYGSPAIDLAHASLFTSTTWDLDLDVVLSRNEVLGFYRSYLGHLDTGSAQRLRPWLAPARRLTWLRTMTWSARWLAADPAPSSEISPELLAHIRRRVAAFFNPTNVARVRGEWLERPMAF